jgi:N-acetylmuramate 1-kinase
VLIHRDLQSSNILSVKGHPYFIDFQGMRLGAAAYDLASLLCDPYAELPIGIQKQLLAAYNDAIPVNDRIAENIFWAAAVQRLSQALGAYARLSAAPETARFEKHILPGSRMMMLALQQSGLCPKLQSVMRETMDSPGPAQDASTPDVKRKKTK